MHTPLQVSKNKILKLPFKFKEATHTHTHAYIVSFIYFIKF